MINGVRVCLWCNAELKPLPKCKQHQVHKNGFRRSPKQFAFEVFCTKECENDYILRALDGFYGTRARAASSSHK